jgi:hypothetical protein
MTKIAIIYEEGYDPILESVYPENPLNITAWISGDEFNKGIRLGERWKDDFSYKV